MLTVKRVILGKGLRAATSRHGAYFKVYDTETKSKSYYKIAGSRGAKTKEAAKGKFSIREQNKMKKTDEDATLHFKLDYTGDARSGHKFQMQDSYITAKVKAGWDDNRVKEYLTDLFNEAFKDQFGKNLSEFIDVDEMTEGLERNQGANEAIRIKYNYGGSNWKEAKTTPGNVKNIKSEKEDFFYKTLRRMKK